MNDIRLDDRVAIITGAAGGFGRVLVRAFRDAGARVAALDVNEVGLRALGESGGGFLTRVTDIADWAACEAAVEATRRNLGQPDILVNNAALGMGVVREDHMSNLVMIDEVTPEMWKRFADTNFSGPWFMTRAAAPGMRERGWGRVINVTTSFFTMLRGSFHPYGPCKAGFEAISAGHAKEFEGTGITVNVPSGLGAPVMIRAAAPGGSSKPGGSPAAMTPATGRRSPASTGSPTA